MSLVEVLITLTVTIIMVVALIAIVLASLKNSQFAQNQAKATKYAQEAIEQIKALRDRDGSVTFNTFAFNRRSPDTCPTALSKFNDLFCFDLTSAASCSAQGGCYFELTNSQSLNWVGWISADSVQRSLANEVGLKREIFIFEDATIDSSKEKKIKVKVLWSDSSGTHESNIQTILGKTR